MPPYYFQRFRFPAGRRINPKRISEAFVLTMKRYAEHDMLSMPSSIKDFQHI